PGEVEEGVGQRRRTSALPAPDLEAAPGALVGVEHAGLEPDPVKRGTDVGDGGVGLQCELFVKASVGDGIRVESTAVGGPELVIDREELRKSSELCVVETVSAGVVFDRIRGLAG